MSVFSGPEQLLNSEKLVLFSPLERHSLTYSIANTSVYGFTYFNRLLDIAPLHVQLTKWAEI